MHDQVSDQGRSAKVTDNPNLSRYEIHLADRLAGFAEYRLSDHEIVFPHTEILPELEGRGLGSALVRAALDDIRLRGLKVKPVCWFVAGFIRRHPEYQDLLADSPSP